MSVPISLMQQGRPPFVTFEQRAEEDRTASIEAKGRKVFKDVDYVIIRSPGSKDTVEKIAPEWLAHCDQMVSKGKWPVEWANAHRKMYGDWKAGLEIVPIGFSVRQWAGISKAQAENLVMAGVPTVEDLAAANEQALAKIGMGARQLKEKAQSYIDGAKGNVGEELNALRAQLSDLAQTVGRLTEKNAELEAEVQKYQPPGKKRA
jgi:hypothetical protein